MRFARSGGSLEHDVQPLAEVVSGVEAAITLRSSPRSSIRSMVPQVRLGIAQSRAFDQALDPGVHVTGVRAVDGEPDHLSVAQWHGVCSSRRSNASSRSVAFISRSLRLVSVSMIIASHLPMFA